MAIGDQRLSRRGINAPAPRVDSSAFGAGIARGLQGLSQSVEQFGQTEFDVEQAYKARQDKSNKFRAQSAFLRFTTDLDKDLAERKLNAPLDPNGFTNDYDSYVQQRLEEFSSTLPEDLREEFQPKLEQARSSLITNAFSFEMEKEASAFGLQLAEFRQEAVNDILQGGDADAWAADLSELLSTAPLEADMIEELRTGSEEMLQTAALEQELGQVSDPVSTPTVEVDGTTVLAGMPDVVHGLATTIAGTESPGYNVLNGGETFSDYSKHPNRVGANGKSTAAGKYQFIHATWERARKALNLPDFSPASQDKAFWWLAAGDYKKRTGRDLMADLNTGDPQIYGRIRRTLAGNGEENVTWQGLQNLTDEQFFQQVTGAKAPTPAILGSDRYNAVPYRMREDLWQKAQIAQASAITQQQQAFQEATTAAMSSMMSRIEAGDATPAMIDELSQEYGLDYAQNAGLHEAWKKKNYREIAIAQTSARLQDTTFEFDQGNSEAADIFAEERLLPIIKEQDIDKFNSAVRPLIERFGFMPTSVEDSLVRFAGSSDANTQTYAMEALASIRATNPEVFERAGISDDLVGAVNFYERNKGFMPADELQSRLNFRRTPEYAAMEQQYGGIARKNFENPDLMEDFSPRQLLRGMGITRAVDNFTGTQLQIEARSIYQQEFIRTRDHDEALDSTHEILNRRWGESRIGGEYSMKHPPEKLYQPYMGNHDYIEEQVRADLGLKPEQGFRLFADQHTERDIADKRPPRYRVMVEQLNELGEPMGVYLPAMNGGFPQLFNAEITDEMRNEQLELFSNRNQRYQLEQELQDLDQAEHEIRMQRGVPIAPEEIQRRREEIKAELNGLPAEPEPEERGTFPRVQR